MPIKCAVRRKCYPVTNRLFITGGGEIQSMEGKTRDNSAAMAIYAIAIIPMIFMLVEISLRGK